MVDVTGDTRIIERVGPAVIGASVKVQGDTNDAGTISALRIKVVPKMPFVKLFGTLLRLSDNAASVSGIPVGIGPLTLKPDELTLDKPIWVKGTLDTNNGILALIMRQRADDDDEEEHDGPTVLRGRIQELPDSPTLEGRWRVSGVPILVTDATKLSRRMGRFRQGAWVQVDGVGSSEGGIVAARVRTTRSHRAHTLIGTFEGRENGQVIVDKIHVDLSSEPLIIGNPTEGKIIVVESRLQDNGKMKAFRLLARENDDDGDKEIHFVGTVDALPDAGLVGPWVIGGRSVNVREATEIDQSKGDVTVGAKVKVHAVVTPNTERSTNDEFIITATEIVVIRSDKDDDDEHGGRYVEFVGEVGDLPPNGLLGMWMVAERKVVVGARTELEGEAADFVVGALVKVEGYLPKDGPIIAREIEVVRAPDELPEGREVIFAGKVEEKPDDGLLGTWVIKGIQVEVVADTEIDENLGELGDNSAVIVVGTMQPDGSILAAKLKTAIEDVDEPVRYTKFKGIVKQLPDNPMQLGEWVVAVRDDEMVTVNVTQGTIIHDRREIVVGAKVEVEGVTALDGSVVAFKIKELEADDDDGEDNRFIRFHGLVESGPDNADGIGQWTIISRPGRVRTVVANAETEFKDGIPAIGDPVEVKGKPTDDDLIIALKIESETDNDED